MGKHFISLLKLIGLSILFSFSLSSFAEPEVTVKSLIDKESKEQEQHAAAQEKGAELKQAVKATAITAAVKEQGGRA
ncbi:hypothetical protein [Pseudoalteromonas prydzensis]|uniref:hypothetical protein n=1 Tax=Pseudoalteromonas prydzensis TaxID=182141 RepID=UPI003703A791